MSPVDTVVTIRQIFKEFERSRSSVTVIRRNTSYIDSWRLQAHDPEISTDTHDVLCMYSDRNGQEL